MEILYHQFFVCKPVDDSFFRRLLKKQDESGSSLYQMDKFLSKRIKEL